MQHVTDQAMGQPAVPAAAAVGAGSALAAFQHAVADSPCAVQAQELVQAEREGRELNQKAVVQMTNTNNAMQQDLQEFEALMKGCATGCARPDSRRLVKCQCTASRLSLCCSAQAGPFDLAVQLAAGSCTLSARPSCRCTVACARC